MKNCVYLRKTLDNLEAHLAHGSIQAIADNTSLTYDWVRKVRSGAISDPGIKKLEELNSFIGHASSEGVGHWERLVTVYGGR